MLPRDPVTDKRTKVDGSSACTHLCEQVEGPSLESLGKEESGTNFINIS